MFIKKIISSAVQLLKRYSGFLTIPVYAAIIILSLIPGNIQGISNYDKIEHFTAYFILSFLCSYSFRNRILFFIILNIAMGLIIEYIQSFIPGRDMSAFDAIANSLGILSGYIIFMIVIKFETPGKN
jgi:VanZ family protein